MNEIPRSEHIKGSSISVHTQEDGSLLIRDEAVDQTVLIDANIRQAFEELVCPNAISFTWNLTKEEAQKALTLFEQINKLRTAE